MNMNQHIVTTACPPGNAPPGNAPPGNARLLRSHCSGASFGPHQAGGVISGNASSCCCARNRLFLNGRWIQRQTDKPNAK